MTQHVWRQCDHIAYVDSDERVVLLDLSQAQDEPRVLSASASAVWRAVDGNRNDAEVAAAVADWYSVATDVVAADVYAFLDELARLRLIEPAQLSGHAEPERSSDRGRGVS